MSGYSRTPLQKKLGIKDGEEISVINSPIDYFDFFDERGLLMVSEKLSPNVLFIQYFQTDLKKFEEDFFKLRDSLNKSGML